MSSDKNFSLEDVFTLDDSHGDEELSLDKENSSGSVQNGDLPKQVMKKAQPLGLSPNNPSDEYSQAVVSSSDDDIQFLHSVPSKFITISDDEPSSPSSPRKTGLSVVAAARAYSEEVSHKLKKEKPSLHNKQMKAGMRKPTRGPDGVMGYDLTFTDDSENDYDPDEDFESSNGDDEIVDPRSEHEIPVSKELDYIELLELRLSRRIKKQKKAKSATHKKSCNCAICKPHHYKKYDDGFGGPGRSGLGGGSSLAF